MIKFVGFLIVISSVLGGYVLSHGELLTLWQPFELLIIGGSALGAFVVANPLHVVIDVFRSVGRSFFGRRHGQAMYMDLLSLLYELFNKARRNGLMSIEEDVEEPKASDMAHQTSGHLHTSHPGWPDCEMMPSWRLVRRRAGWCE
jgi:chemotaxis protein MotA